MKFLINIICLNVSIDLNTKPFSVDSASYQNCEPVNKSKLISAI